MIKAGVSKEEIKKLIRLCNIYSDLSVGLKDPLDGKPSSAYDTIYRKVSDCDSDAQLYSAVLDAAGYSNAIFATKTHAFLAAKIKSDWYGVEGIIYTKYNSEAKKDLINSKEYKFLERSTSGKFE